jgi:hypothetical protein
VNVLSWRLCLYLSLHFANQHMWPLLYSSWWDFLCHD